MTRVRTTTALLILLLAVAAARSQPAASPHGDLATACLTCHGDASWETGDGPADFDHDSVGYPLTDAHRGVACTACHESLIFSRIGVACADCHTDAHLGSLGFDCELCHTPRGWENRSLMRERHDTTSFPLRGAHRQADCNACHSGQDETVWAATPVDCYACHAVDYHATSAPPHGPAGFDHDCSACHDPFASAWGGERFLHPDTFPLTGAHAVTDCAACHTDGFGGLSTDCYACHQDDYDATTDPGHTASGFPVTCADCHGTSAWTPADWDHDSLFPIYTGRHSGEWDNCVDCHLTPSDYALFECIYCHEHSPEETDSRHDDVDLYLYESIACFDCHPRGEGED